MIAHLDDRVVLTVSGEGAREFLNGLVTSDVAALAPETPVWTALLSAQGKYVADMMLFDGGAAGIFVDVHRERADDLARKLKLYRLRRPIDITPSRLHVFAGWKLRDLPRPHDPRHAALGHRWLAAGGSVDATAADWHAHRIALGIPDTPDFVVDGTMWLETNAAELAGVSFSKGCFVGQENTARMNWRAKVSRRLLPVAIDGDPGGERRIMAGNREAGELRSVAGARGIALIRLDHVDAPLTAGPAAVRIAWPDWLPRATVEKREG
jgi:hypothetical protein